LDFLKFFEIKFPMWPTKKKPSQHHIVKFGEGVFRIFFLQEWKLKMTYITWVKSTL